jgi:hypothetical protein
MEVKVKETGFDKMMNTFFTIAIVGGGIAIITYYYVKKAIEDKIKSIVPV